MSFSNAFETHLLTYLFTSGTPSPTRPTAWHVAAFTSNPAEDASGTEVSGNGYTRKPATFTVSGNLATNSTAAIEFPTCTGSNWGAITHIGVFDAATSGNLIAYSALSSTKTIEVGDVLRIPQNDLDVSLD